MRQRACIALATVCRPDFIIADEPTTALDVMVQQNVLAMLDDIRRSLGSSVVFVTHDMSVHANMADRIGIMYAGRIVEEGPTRALFTKPRHPYTAHLVASLPRIGDTSRKSALGGRPPNLSDPPTGCRFHPRCPLAIKKCETKRFAIGGVLSRSYVDAVIDASFTIEEGQPEVFTIVGESGSGKTTLARMILGLKTPTEGEVRLSGRGRADRRGRAGRVEFMRHVQPVFQNPFETFNPLKQVDRYLRASARVLLGAAAGRASRVPWTRRCRRSA